MKTKDENNPSRSYVMGVIALVFLIIGYQTALFVHRAAVLKIEANRDHPDTVYIYERVNVADVKSADTDKALVTAVRKNYAHSSKVTAVRDRLPRQQVESFPFDPNKVTYEDLCRLGFSSKQAQSIINYRQKGGRFRRKTDFARSYVVSDSVYARLESYIDIPLLDLNLADSADFDALPGIGGWFASRMVEYRKALKGYSYKEQLMDIWKFDRQKYEALSDLITVSHQHMTPYQLWTLPADSLKMHPYIKNYETARAIVLFRENTMPEDYTVEALEKAGILSSEYACKLSRCFISTPVRSSGSL